MEAQCNKGIFLLKKHIMTYFTVKTKPFCEGSATKLSRGPLHILSDPGRADYFELTLAL